MAEEKAPSDAKHFRVPFGVALAAMVLALLCGAITIWQIGEPLAVLVLGQEPDIPIPDGATLEQEWEGQGSAQKEWLYSTETWGCDVAQFYIDQGAECVFSPYSCELEQQDPPEGVAFEIHEIAECSKSVDGVISGYTWRVHITSYSSGLHTRFRILLYE